MNTQKTYSLGPFAVLTFIYFIVGFLTTVNGQFQGPLKVGFLSEAEGLRNTLTTLISFFFFLGYLVNSSLGGKWINAHGYKPTLLRALGVMIGGLLMYAMSSLFITLFPDTALRIGEDAVSYGYFIFLFGSFLMGTSAALLQVVINPYIAAYELPNTQPVQRVNIVCAINSLGTTLCYGSHFLGCIFRTSHSAAVACSFPLDSIEYCAYYCCYFALVASRFGRN